VVLKRAVRGLDSLLSRANHVYPFSQQPDCILRLALGKSDRDLILPDGTIVHRGDPIGELHLWNERVPPMPKDGPDLAWAHLFLRRFSRSLVEVAAFVQAEPRFQQIQVFRGESSFMGEEGLAHLAGLAGRLGFETVQKLPEGKPAGFWKRFAEFWEGFYVMALMAAYNPGSLRRKRLWRLKRGQIWMSRAVLLARYDRGEEAPAEGDRSGGLPTKERRATGQGGG
jgi:YkoP domain